MFADACEKAMKFTRPVIISTRTHDKNVNAICGTFIVLNDEGWIITAGHIFDSYVKYQEDQKKIKELDELNKSHISRPGSPNSDIQYENDWIVNHSFWWGWDGVRLDNVYVNRQLDIAVGKLTPFNKAWITEYPVFRDAETIRSGTSLCRLGFPFVPVATEFDENTKAFRIKKGVLPLTLFPNDGMHTRNISKGLSKDGNYDMLYVETSTPGLRGQSGGPIYDTEGRIYALQVQTAHIPLGFQPTIEIDGKRVTENQFINVGLGIHGKTIQSVLQSRNVKFNVEGKDDGYRIVD